jgi:hypothetical protein
LTLIGYFILRYFDEFLVLELIGELFSIFLTNDFETSTNIRFLSSTDKVTVAICIQA